MSMNPVGWFEIYIDDMNRAKKFYETVLATELNPLPGAPGGELQMLAFPANPENRGSGGALVHMSDMKAGGNSILVYFNCENCAVEAGRIEAAGGKLFRDKMAIGQYGFVALGHDTEGNMFGLHSME